VAAVDHDLYIEQGATFTVTFEWREDSATGPLIDTAGYSPRMQIRQRPGSSVLLTVDSSITAVGGIIALRIGADITATLTHSGVYDIELHSVSDSTEVVRLAQGAVTLSREVTTS
jgi:hypothetical protein